MKSLNIKQKNWYLQWKPQRPFINRTIPPPKLFQRFHFAQSPSCFLKRPFLQICKRQLSFISNLNKNSKGENDDKPTQCLEASVLEY